MHQPFEKTASTPQLARLWTTGNLTLQGFVRNSNDFTNRLRQKPQPTIHVRFALGPYRLQFEGSVELGRSNRAFFVCACLYPQRFAKAGTRNVATSSMMQLYGTGSQR